MVDRALQPVHAPRLPTILTSDLGRDSHILSPKQGDFCHLWRSLNLWQRFTLIFVQRFWQSQWRSLTLLERQVSSRHSALLHVLKPEGFYVQLAVPDVEIVLCSCLTFDEHDSSAAVHQRGKLMSNATSAVRWWCCIHVLYKHFTVLHIYIIYTYTFYIIPRFYIFGLRLRMFCLPLVHKLRMPQTRRFIGYGLWIAVRSWEEKF